MEKEPICPLCGIRERSYDGEPPVKGDERDYFSHCYECSRLAGYGEHSHTYYPNPEQIKAGTFKAGHSWRTLVSLNPIMEGGEHVGYRCTQFQKCGWEHRFTAKELEICTAHTDLFGHPMGRYIKGVCVNSRTHRMERGECNEQGYITDKGRAENEKRSDAQTWDPGHYVSPW